MYKSQVFIMVYSIWQEQQHTKRWALKAALTGDINGTWDSSVSCLSLLIFFLNTSDVQNIVAPLIKRKHCHYYTIISFLSIITRVNTWMLWSKTLEVSERHYIILCRLGEASTLLYTVPFRYRFLNVVCRIIFLRTMSLNIQFHIGPCLITRL